MKKFEHLSVLIDYMKLDEELAEREEKGWELAGFTDWPGTSKYHLVFKREQGVVCNHAEKCSAYCHHKEPHEPWEQCSGCSQYEDTKCVEREK